MATQTVYNYTQQNLPEWYSQYLQNVMGRAVGAADEPYQQYTGPLVAGLTPEQQQAYAGISNMQGAVSPWLNEATGMTQMAANANTGDAGAAAFGDATGLFNRGAETTYDIASPFIDTGRGYLEQSTQGSGAAAANPYIMGAVAPTGIAAASPYLQAAGTSFPGMAGAYMSPYISGVTDRIAQLGARNLSENLLPQISDQFVRAGQYGSPQQRDIIGRAIRDTQESVLGQQAESLERGYGVAGQLYGQDAARYAGLAGTAGGLGTAQQQIGLSAGQTLGNLTAEDLSRLAAAGVNIGNLGLSQAGLAGADASRAIQAGQGISNIGQAQIQAAQADEARRLQAGAQMGNIAQLGQGLNLQQLAALESSGAAQQAQNQRGIDTAYGQFREQRDYPWTQVGNLSNVIQGLPVNTSTSSQTTQPGPSTIGQIGGIGLGIAGLAQSGIFKAKGGAVLKRHKRHSYGRMKPRGLSFAEAA